MTLGMTIKERKAFIEERQKRNANHPKFPMRRGLVLDRMSTKSDHNAGDVIMWDGPETSSIRELTSSELDDYAENNAKEETVVPPEAGSADAFKDKARSTVMTEALSKLDHDDDASWTESGQPTVLAVSRALMHMQITVTDTSRAEIRKFAPDFRRSAEESGADS